MERVTFTETEPLSSLIATRLAAKSIITDLQMDDYNSTSSRQARFAEQQEADKKQELIDISIQHQILSPFTAFIGIETRTEQEKAAMSGEMILREVPIEIRANGRPLNDSSDEEEDEKCDDNDLQYSDDVESEDDEYMGRKKTRYILDAPGTSFKCKRAISRSRSRSPQQRISSSCWADEDDNIFTEKECAIQRTGGYRNFLRSRSRSRSPYLKRRNRISSGSKDDEKNDNNPSDIIRQIIDLQNFSGLWSFNDLNKIISLMQQTQNIDFKKILDEYNDKDNNIILSMIIMFIFMKYFTADESLWKPIIKKCAKTMEYQLGKDVYNEISDRIRQTV